VILLDALRAAALAVLGVVGSVVVVSLVAVSMALLATRPKS